MNTILQKRIDTRAAGIGLEFRDAIVMAGINRDTSEAVATLTQTAALVMAEWLLEHMWISVEEELPEGCCFAMYEDGGIIVAKYENETWWWQDGFVVGRNTDGDLMYSSSCEVPSGLITHWMPIPQLKGGEK